MTRRSIRRSAALTSIALLSIVLVPLVAPAPAAAASEPVVVIEGRGWGHGRGMSQWGSLGYAVNHNWDWRQILGHYYSNTTEGNLASGSEISVRLDAMGAGDTIVVRQDGGLRTSATGDAPSTAWLIRPEGTQYRIYSGPGCGGPWSTDHGLHATNDVRVFYPSDQGDTIHHSQMLQVCEPSGGRTWYRGDIHARRGTANEHRTVNVTTMERYLRGVVPRESPASWGDAGGGRGINALKAQAVTARSYAAAENRTSYAKTCDTTSCQVYAGAYHADPGGGPAPREDPRTDRAIAETAGVVRMLGGRPARTEYSSSTGGWTAGGTFPAVEDLGDAYVGNPNHTWRVELRIAAIEGRFPQIGRFTGMQVTARNGLGADGGRVTAVVIRGTAGSVTRTGMQFRSDFMARGNCTAATGSSTGCVKSDWFRPIYAPAAGVAVADTGFWVVRADGAVENRNGAAWHGDMSGRPLNAPVFGMAANPAGTGYWLAAADGGIFTFGSARFHGSTGAMHLNQSVVGLSSTASGNGYWLVARDGGIFTFGDARFHGSTGAMRLNQPVVGMAPTVSGNGYWLVARDGGIFTFGDARFFGSTGGRVLNQPIVGMARTPTGRGYWLVAADGGVFAFGDAAFHGSLAGSGSQVLGMAPSAGGNGYWLVTSHGTVHAFGDAA